MPFTLAHPAVVVPLRRVLVLSALVTGSLTPDFHYFLNLGPEGHFSHSIVGAFVYCLPVSLALFWIFQQLVKLPLISLAPEAHQQRLVRFATSFTWGPTRRFLLIVCALLIGIFSHLAWDSFTHDSGFFVRNVPDLRAPALEEWGSHRPVFNMLQHASSLLGMGILAVWYWLWFKRTPPQPVPPNLKIKAGLRWWIAVATFGIAGSAALVDAYIDSGHLASRSLFAGTFAITFMSLVLIEVFCFSLWWHWRARSVQHSALGTQQSALSSQHSAPGHTSTSRGD